MSLAGCKLNLRSKMWIISAQAQLVPSQVDFGHTLIENQAHVTPKNAQIILPLQGPNGLPRAAPKAGKTPARGLFELDKRMGHQKANNPYRQQMQLLRERENVYQNKINKMHSEFKAELMKSHAYAGIAHQHTVDQSLLPGTFSGNTLMSHTDVNKKTTKMPETSPTPNSSISKVI